MKLELQKLQKKRSFAGFFIFMGEVSYKIFQKKLFFKNSENFQFQILKKFFFRKSEIFTFKL